MLHPDVALWNWNSQQGRDLATSGWNKKKSIGPILFLYYEESLVSSNFDSKQLWFHGVRPSVHTVTYKVLFIILGGYIISMKLPCDNPWMV